jgi:hypothetical protein
MENAQVVESGIQPTDIASRDGRRRLYLVARMEVLESGESLKTTDEVIAKLML